MKHLLIIYSLLALSLAVPAAAQEEASSSQESVPQIEQEHDKGMKVDVSFEDDIDDDLKIKRVTDFISEFDSEFGSKMEVKLGSLSDDEKSRLVEKLDEGFTFSTDHDGIPAGAILIALPAVILIFGMPLFLLVALLSFGHRKRKQKMQLVDMYIKSDRDIPEHVLSGLDNGGAASSLKSGLTLTFVGIGIVAAFGALGAEEVGGFGLIPMFLGIARLIFWYLVERKVEPTEEQR